MSLAAIAEAAGASDLFVLHRLTPHHLVNLDGHGRGAGWAGNIEIDPDAEPWLATVLEDGLSGVRYGVPRRILGPYWGTEAVGVALEGHVIVFGGPGTAAVERGRIGELAERAAMAIQDVPAEKRLADELEVTQAALAVAMLRHRSLEETAVAIASAAARVASCEFGAVLLYGPPLRLFVAEDGWRPAATEEEIVAALLPLGEAVGAGIHVEQDMAESPYPYRPLSSEDGLVARCAVPLGSPAVGLLVVAHSLESPRGFTMLCQRVLGAVASAADGVLEPLLS